MRSKSGFAAAILFLSGLPAAVLLQAALGVDAEMVFHFALAAGSALLCVAALDLATPVWVRWLGAAATAALAVTFLLQGLEPAHPKRLAWMARL